MPLEGLVERAKRGDVGAMLALGYAYAADETNTNYDSMMNALPWYECAAEAGNSEGAMQAVLIYNILALTSEQIPDYEGAIDEYNKIIELTKKVFMMREVPEEKMSSAKESYIKAHYRIALCYNVLKQYGMSLIYLNSIEYTDFNIKLLRGVCEYEIAEDESGWSEAYQLLSSIEEELFSFVTGKNKSFLEYFILAKGYIFLSHLYYFGIGGAYKDLKKAENIIITGYHVIPDNRLKNFIAEELDRYK